MDIPIHWMWVRVINGYPYPLDVGRVINRYPYPLNVGQSNQCTTCRQMQHVSCAQQKCLWALQLPSVCGAVERLSLHLLVSVCGAVERLCLHLLVMWGGGGYGEGVSSLAGHCVWGAMERVSLHLLVIVCVGLWRGCLFTCSSMLLHPCLILASVCRPQCSTGHHAAALGLSTNTPQTQLCCLQK